MTDAFTGKRGLSNNKYQITMTNCYDIKVGDEYSSTPVNTSTSFNLKICQDVQMNKYKTNNAYMTSLLWSEEDYDFPISECFVDVKLQKADKLGRKTGEIIPIKDIFAKKAEKHQTILIVGDPGYGKTTTCKKIAFDWGKDEERRDYLRHFDMLVVVELRELGDKNVVDAVLESVQKNADNDFRRKLREANWNFLVILDGFDEVQDKECVRNFITSDSFHISEKMTIVITSRPHVTDEIKKCIEYQCFIEGFSMEQKEKYIEFIIKEDKNKREYLTQVIKTDSLYFELAKCPLMLHLLCCLPESKYDKGMKTKTDLFILIFRLIIERYKKKKVNFQNLKPGNYFDGEDLIIKLGELYFRKEIQSADAAASSEMRRIKDEDLRSVFSKEKDRQFILSLDIFLKRSESKKEPYFEFIHGLFMEFVMALYIYHSINTAALPEIYGILVFVFGLFRNNAFPDNLVNYLRISRFHPATWWNFYREINSERNKRLFISNAKLILYYDCLDELLKLSHINQFQEIYFCIPDQPDYCEDIKRELIKFHNIANYSHRFEVRVILDRRLSDDSSTGYVDIYDSVTFLINILKSYSWEKFNIRFYGIIRCCNSEFSISDRDIHTFRSVEKDATEEIRREFRKRNEEALVLHSQVEAIGLIKYLISEDQFECLEPYIMIDPYQRELTSNLVSLTMD